jgi:hypothetical protein
VRRRRRRGKEGLNDRCGDHWTDTVVRWKEVIHCVNLGGGGVDDDDDDDEEEEEEEEEEEDLNDRYKDHTGRM